MIDIDIHELTEKLGFWPGTEWLLTLFPHWLLPAVGLFLTIGLLAGAKLVLEWRTLRLDSQYKGMWPGELGISISLGAMIAGLLYYAGPVISPFWRSTAWDVITACTVFVAVVPLAVAEYYFAFKHRHTPDYVRPRHVYTFSQLHSPSCLVHRFGMAAVAYLFAKVWVVAMFTGSVPPLLKLVAIAGVMLWLCGLFYDNFVERPDDLDDVHPYRGAWFRIGNGGRRSRASASAYGSSSRPLDETPLPPSRRPVAPATPTREWPASVVPPAPRFEEAPPAWAPRAAPPAAEPRRYVPLSETGDSGPSRGTGPSVARKRGGSGYVPLSNGE